MTTNSTAPEQPEPPEHDSTRASHITRLLLGLVFFVFSLDGVLHFVPLPPMPPDATAFLDALRNARLFYAVKALELVAVSLLLLGRRVPLALTLLGPVVFNIVWFDAWLDPKSLPVGLLVLALFVHQVRTHAATFGPLLRTTRPRAHGAA